jgi:hypothetical protein
MSPVLHVAPDGIRIAVERIAVAGARRERDLVDVRGALADIDLPQLEEFFPAADLSDVPGHLALAEPPEDVGVPPEIVGVGARGIAPEEPRRGGDGRAR